MMETQTPEWLRPHLHRLPAELIPERDLWPGIARRLDPPRHRWIPVAVAASILISVASALCSWNLYETRRQETTLAMRELERIESPYMAARAVYTRQWPELRSQLDPETVKIFERNLRIIHNANAELMNALRKQPGNPALQRLLQQTLSQELDLYQRAMEAAYQST